MEISQVAKGGVVAIAVAALAYMGYETYKRPDPIAPCTPTSVTVLTGSAKVGFLTEPRVVAELAKQCLVVKTTVSGSMTQDLAAAKNYDAVWPAGAAAAEEFAKQGGAKSPIFSTVLVVGSWKPLVPMLSQNGFVKDKKDYGVLYLDKLLPEMIKGTKWNSLANSEAFPINKALTIAMPNVQKSQTSVQALSLFAYTLNNQEPLTTVDQAVTLGTQLKPIVQRQGFQESTLAGPFEDYTGAPGMGKVPMVLLYESQFLAAKRQGILRDKHLMLYPEPGLTVKHTWVGYSEAGKKLGTILATNAVVQQVAAEQGYRTNDVRVFDKAVATLIKDMPELLNQADLPMFSVMDQLAISAQP